MTESLGNYDKRRLLDSAVSIQQHRCVIDGQTDRKTHAMFLQEHRAIDNTVNTSYLASARYNSDIR